MKDGNDDMVFSFLNKIELSAIFTIAFVLANTFIFILQFGYLSYYGVAYDYINVSLTSLIIAFIISVFTISICKVIIDSYTDIYVNKYIKKEKYFPRLKSKGIKSELTIKRSRRFFTLLSVSSLAWIMINSVVLFCYIRFEFNPLNIDISDFLLVTCGLPALLAIFTFILTRINIKAEKIRANIKHRYYSPVFIKNQQEQFKEETVNRYFKNKLAITYLIIVILFFFALMFFLFIAGDLIARNKKQYGTFYDNDLKKNYLIINAYGEYRVVMEYTGSENDTFVTTKYGEYRVIPINNINEKIITFNHVNIEK